MFGLDKDTGNLIIIISVLGILTCLCLWLLKSLNIILKNHDIKEVENYLSWIGVSLAFLILLMIFVTAGDLGILLLVGSIVSFLLMIVGLITKNTEIIKTGRGWFLPFFLIFILITLINDKSVIDLVNNPDLQIKSETQSGTFFNIKIITVLLLYIPIQMIFWFAPQLVVWGNLNSIKAMFYSFFAVLLNWKSFLTYLLTWIMVLLSISIFIALLINLFKIDQGSLVILFLPISLLIMGIAHGSYYASTKTIFSDLVTKHSNTNPN